MAQRGMIPSVAINVQQLRDRIIALTAGHQTQKQKTEYICNYFSKWSAGRQRVSYNQFFAALQSLSLPLTAVSEVFGALDRDHHGTIDIKDFCDFMFGSGGGSSPNQLPNLPPTLPGVGAPPSGRPPLGSGRLGSAMRSAGSAVLGGGASGGYDASPSARPPSGLRQGQLASGQCTPTGAGGMTPTNTAGKRQSGVRISSARSNMSARSGNSSARRDSSRGPLTKLNLSDMLLEQFSHAILQLCGPGGIHALGRRFRILDNDGNRRVTMSELRSGLKDVGLHLEDKDIHLLLAAIDKDKDGSLGFDELIVAIRGVVNQRRETLIHMAFRELDRSGDGRATIDDIRMTYNTAHHPEVMQGRLGESEALGHFLSQFDGVNHDGCVTFPEFLEYYKSVSASIDDDDYFELMIRNAWHIPGGQSQYENTANTRLLVSFEDGSQEVVALQHDRGLDLRNGDAVRSLLESQGITGAVGYSLSN